MALDRVLHGGQAPRSVAEVMRAKGWMEIQMAELRAIWAYQQRRGICFNGCTHAALVARYGADNVQHISGIGWFKRA